jgi:PAS domain S-box-containing protein
MMQDDPKPNALTLTRPATGIFEGPGLGELLSKLFEHVLSGVSCSRIIFKGDEPVDRLYLYTNQAFRSLTGVDNVAGRLVSEVHPGGGVDAPEFLMKLARIARSGESEVFEHHDSIADRWFSMSAYSPAPDHVVTVFDNITGRKRLEAERESYRQELERRVEEQMQELRESEERFRGLFESLPVGIVVQAPNGEITEANQAACELLRLTMDQFTGMASLDPSWKPVHEDGSPFSGEEHPAMVALATGKPQLGVIMCLGDGNDRTWISINSHPLFRKGLPVPYAALTTYLDITKHVQDEEVIRTLNRHYHELLDASTEVGIIATDLNGIVTLFNPGAQRMLGYTEEEVVGHATPRDLHPGDQMDAAALELGQKPGSPLDGLQAILETVEKQGPLHRDWTYLRKDGSKFRASVWITPVRSAQGELTGHLAVIHNIGGKVPA